MRNENTSADSTSRPLRRAPVRALIGVLGLAGFAAGCGGDDGSSQGVATIDPRVSDADETEGSAESDDKSFEDAMAEYTACMQAEGIDIAQPIFADDDGAVVGATSGGDGHAESQISADEIDELVNNEDYRAAQDKCEPIIDGAFQMLETDPELEAERQDHVLEWTQCMRDRGHDMPDPTLSDDGAAVVETAEAEAGFIPTDDEQMLEDTAACHERASEATGSDVDERGDASTGDVEGGATGE